MEKVKQEVRFLRNGRSRKYGFCGTGEAGSTEFAEWEKREVQNLRNGRSGKYRICGTGEAGSTDLTEKDETGRIRENT